jgi:hypothetical protein
MRERAMRLAASLVASPPGCLQAGMLGGITVR